MDKKHRKILVDWVIPIGLVIVLYLTGWYKPVAVGMQRLMLSTGIIKPSIELTTSKNDIVVDYNWRLQRFDGSQLSLSDYQGKVVFLNYFATWCPPCVAEMPGIQALYDDLKADSNITFLIVSRDDSNEKVEAFMQKKGYTLPVVTSASRTPSMLHTNVLPTTYIIAPDGRIVSSHEGMADYDNDKVRNALKTLAAGINPSALSN